MRLSTAILDTVLTQAGAISNFSHRRILNLFSRPTIGCVIYVLHAVHETQGKYFVELWDLGGNPRFRDARPICYEDCDGYIFLW